MFGLRGTGRLSIPVVFLMGEDGGVSLLPAWFWWRSVLSAVSLDEEGAKTGGTRVPRC